MKEQKTLLPLDHEPVHDRAGIGGATRTACRVVVAAFMATALRVAALMVERLVLHRACDAAVKNVKVALSTADAVLLSDKRLTMSAHLAAATGEKRWIDRYEAHFPLIDRAIAAAAALAPASAAARFDAATRVANDKLVAMEPEGRIARTAREQGSFALLVLDRDGFKPINDRHGHGAGDEVLTEVSQRLNAHVRKGDIAARLGGDEFVLVLKQSATSDAPARGAAQLIAALSEPVMLPQGEVRVNASVGVAFYPGDAQKPDDLIRKADVALYRAKNGARGEVRFFQSSMDDDVHQRESLELDLRTAIAANPIKPNFQSLVDLEQSGLIGFEVLARWPHATRGMVPPTEFVPIAEDSGQIDALTVCVMRPALLAARGWDARLSIAINIAPQQLKIESLIERLLGVLRETGFPPERFEVEITENALIGGLDMARRTVLRLKSHGIRVALDDFGTGFSSLSHLSELPFDKIKIDRSFIHTMRDRHENATIVNAIIGLRRSLNLPTTTEGIETPADAESCAIWAATWARVSCIPKLYRPKMWLAWWRAMRRPRPWRELAACRTPRWRRWCC